jgi:O-antigen ligase
MVRLGIVGLALYLYALYWAFRMITALIKDARDDEGRRWGITFLAALVAFLIQGMFENVHSGPPAVVFYTLLAMITIFWRIQREDDANDVAGHEKGCTT